MRGTTLTALGAATYGVGVATALVATLAGGLEDAPMPALAGVILCVGALAAVVARSSRVEHLRDSRVAALLVLGIAAIALLALGVSVRGSAGGRALEVAVAASAIGFVGWETLVRGVRTDHAERLLADGAERLASLPDLEDGRISTRWRALLGAVGVVSLAFAAYGLTSDASGWVVSALAALTFLAFALESPKSVTVTDRGVLFETRFGARLFEWSALGGYYRGDRLLLLRASRWDADLAFDADEVEADAIDAVDDHLPRSPSPALPAGGLADDRTGEASG